MFRNQLPALGLAVMLCLFVFGCADGITGIPTGPDLIPVKDQSSISSGRAIWGMWDVAIDGTTGEVVIEPIRGAMFNANVQQFLSPPFSPTNMMKITILGASDFTTGYIECEVELGHPFIGMEMYKGFDVRGIFMADGNKTGDHDPGIRYGSEASGDSYMLNPDGHTRWWNAKEFIDPLPLLSFKPGKMGNLDDPSATLNPYKYFADELGVDDPVSGLNPENRGVFTPTTMPNGRLYQIQFGSPAGVPVFEFTYAVDASWDAPDPMYDPDFPLESFPPGAQCQEPFHIEFESSGDAWYDNGSWGGSLQLSVTVFDWQGISNLSGVPGELSAIWIESPVFAAPIDILPIADAMPNGILAYDFSVELDSSLVVPPFAGIHSIMLTTVSEAPDSYQPQLDGGENFIFPPAPLAAYHLGTVSIAGEEPPPPPIVTAVDPDFGIIDTMVTDLEITGENFEDGATVEFYLDTEYLTITNVNWTDSTLITCDVDCTGTDGLYTVRVTNPDSQFGELIDGFEVTDDMYPCAPYEYSDDFESYYVGQQVPFGDWVNFWSGYISGCYVTDQQAYSGTKGYRQQAYPYWARYDGLPFTYNLGGGEHRTYVCFEGRVMITDPIKQGRLGFAWKTSGSTTGHYAVVTIGNSSGYTETYHWYHVLAKINMETNTWHVWVDDELYIDGTVCGTDASRNAFSHFFMGITNFPSGYGIVYFDDITLYWDVD